MSPAWDSIISLSFRSGKWCLTFHSAMHRPKWSSVSASTAELAGRWSSINSPAGACYGSRRSMLMRRTRRTNPTFSPLMGKGVKGTRPGRRPRPAFCASLDVNAERSTKSAHREREATGLRDGIRDAQAMVQLRACDGCGKEVTSFVHILVKNPQARRGV